MRIARRQQAGYAEGDMTPMIDMTFQLIAFFMVLINFTEADQNERIHLPASELAKPAEVPFESPITLQLTKAGTVLLGGEEAPVADFTPLLQREKQFLLLKAGPKRRAQALDESTIIIRADADAQTGMVQELIRICQDAGFEKFALRAKQEDEDARR